jgi:hypothetical protein
MLVAAYILILPAQNMLNTGRLAGVASGAPSAAGGGWWGTSPRRQMGQVLLEAIQASMHGRWKLCRQGSRRSTSPVSYSPRQMVQAASRLQASHPSLVHTCKSLAVQQLLESGRFRLFCMLSIE